MREQLIKEILKHKVVVILRGIEPGETVEICEILAQAGLRFMEIPLNTPNALECIKLAAEHFADSDVQIGAGTVLTSEDVDAVAESGGKYIISPNIDPDVIKRTCELGLVSIPGFATPTEAFAAVKAGADILKCFPCDSPGKIAVLKSVVPLPVLAVGGISAENRDSYLQTADGLGVGIGIYRPGMNGSELRAAAESFMKGM